MSLASSSYSYPILGAFWTVLMIFLWVIWFWILITIFIDLFRSHDLSGWAKALWFIFILLLPLIGVLSGQSPGPPGLRSSPSEPGVALSKGPQSRP